MGINYLKNMNILGINASGNMASSSQASQLGNTTTDALGSLLNGSASATNQASNGAGDEFKMTDLVGLKTGDIADKISQSTDKKSVDFWTKIQKAFGQLDKNGNGTLESEEVEKLSSLDGDKDNISSEDLKNFFLNNKIDDTETVPPEAPAQPAQSNGAQSAGGGGGKSSGSSGSNGAASSGQSGVAAIQGQTIDEKIKDAEDKITEDEKNEDDANNAVKEEDDNYINQVNEELANDTDNKDQLKTYDDKVTSDEAAITTAKTNLDGITRQIDTVNNDIAELEGELSQIPDEAPDAENGANADQQKELQERKEAIKREIEQKRNELKGLEVQQKAAQEALSTAEKTKADDMKVRDDFVNQLAENNEKIKDIKTEHDKQVPILQEAVDKAKTSLEQHKQDLTALRKQKGEMTGQSEVSKANFNANFDDMMAKVFGYEGGFSNDPDDHGGATNMGITQETYRNWTGDPNANVRNITQEEAKEIYYKNYYQASGAEEVAKTNPQLAFAVFDAAVNHGVGRAQEWLQQCDGNVDTFMELRKQKYLGIVANNSSQAKFAKAWQNRWNDVYQFIDPDHQYENYIGS